MTPGEWVVLLATAIGAAYILAFAIDVALDWRQRRREAAEDAEWERGQG